jgi:NAD(P)-dependent dehydrogenase (short-subunit alcohol dehydrogenase family)
MAAVYPDLAGKVVLVTGGASGIGEAIVRRFAQQNSIVVFFDIKVEKGVRLARGAVEPGSWRTLSECRPHRYCRVARRRRRRTQGPRPSQCPRQPGGTPELSPRIPR